MRGLGAAATSAAVVLLSGLGGAYAADLDVKAPVLKAAPADSTCSSVIGFFTTDCQLAAYGIRFYGTVDVGGTYQTNGSKLDKYYAPGLNYFLAKGNHGSTLQFSPG